MKKFLYFRPIAVSDEYLERLKRVSSVAWQKESDRFFLGLYSFVSENVAAYQKFLHEHNVSADTITDSASFKKLPCVDKASYVKKYEVSELVPFGDISQITTFSSTSGSTGEPTYFPRGEEQDWQYQYILELFLRNQFDVQNKKTLCIIGFGLGIWIGGIFTYKNFNQASRAGLPVALAPVGTSKETFLKTFKKIAHLYDQVILMGYPPFIKDVVDDAEVYGVDWADHEIKIMTATEGFSEEFRTYLAQKTHINNKFTDILNIYGSVELGTMAHETPLSVLVRELTQENEALFSAVFPGASFMPTFVQYHPNIIHFGQDNGELFVSGFGSSFPLIRYRMYDKGIVLSYDALNAILEKFDVKIEKELQKRGVDPSCILKLPFVAVYERSDFVIVLRGANIYPENIKNGLQVSHLEDFITGKFTMERAEDKQYNEYLKIHVELKRAVQSSKELVEMVTTSVVNNLLKENSEFNYLYTIEGAKLTPTVLLHPYEDPEYFKFDIKQKWIRK